MEETKKNTAFNKFLKIALYVLLGIILLLLLLAIALNIPSVQTKLGQYATERLNKEFGTDITVQEANFTVFGGVKLKKVLIRDYRKDTLFYINVLKTNLVDAKKLLDGDLHFGEVRLDGLDFHIKNYKGEKDTNLDKFVALFDDGKPSSPTKKKFLMTAEDMHLTNSHFRFLDENLKDQLVFEAKKLNAHTSNFQVLGPDVTMKIEEMAFVDNRGLVVDNLVSDFTYTKKNIHLANLDLETSNSKLKGDVELKYDRKDFADFNNKVIFDIKIDKALVSSNDLNLFYGEFGKNQEFDVRGKLYGSLNNFKTRNLYLVDKNNSEIIGNFDFRNLFTKNKGDFYMKGKFSKISSTYDNLDKLLPRVLGDNLPSTFKKFGRFTLSGETEVTLKTVKANVLLKTALGNVQSNLSMTNIDHIDNATYKGNVKLNNFDLGKFLGRSDLGVVNLDLDADGKGFKEKYLNTQIKGDVQSIYYNGYNYRNIEVDGTMNKSVFNGNIVANDPNLIMEFDGNLDLSKRENKYDFHAKVEYANLKKLNIYTADEISIFRGDVVMDLQGNSIDNIYGNIYINQTSYENSKDTYFFDDFQVKSTFDSNQVRTITINSPDIIEGKVEGKFQFKQLPDLIENSLGSLYANYSPNKVSKGQFVKFDFNVYSKLIEVFYPEISLGENTYMKGEIDSNDGMFKFNFKSPSITAYGNKFDNINIDLDNKNPLYNAYIEMDSIKTKYYKVANLSLINVTANDTLFFRTEFKGGKKGKDYYNLNLYHTINEDNNSVVGIKKSEVNFKDYLWFLNEKEEDDNKIVFNKKLTDFSIEKISMTHGDQVMQLMGKLKDSTYKDVQLSFKDVELDKITPSVDSLRFKGKVNGIVDFKQRKAIYEPTSSLEIDSLNINNFALGKLNVDVKGDNSFKNFRVNSVLRNNGMESFSADGNVFIEGRSTKLDLDLRLEDFNLGIFSPLGGDIIQNIRGLASGTARFTGDFDEPDITGRLYLNKAGLKIPYLNTDYNFGKNSVVDVTENQFSFRNIGLYDSKYNTEGRLTGSIRHNKFADWTLDLNIDSDRMLALDTKDSDGALYYGTAFIDGEASIKGPINGLVINVNAKSSKDTSIKIPINDTEATTEKDYIKFVTKNGIAAQKGKDAKNKNYNGVELNFEFDITPDAEIEVIINKNNGHGLKGRGVGSLLMEINTLGKFNMWGDFQVYKGVYNFKYGGIIDKQFDVKKGGYISWDGNPMNATLNMEAVYTTQANPAVLLDNPSFNKKVPTEVVIKLTDQLTNPTPDISINFPTVGSVLKSELEYKLNDADTRQTQAIYLLSTGSFLTDKGVAENAVTGNLLEKANSLFEDLFSSSDDKLKVRPYIITGDKRNPNLQSDGSVGVTLSTQISDKVTINGKFGVPVGGVTETAVVGDVEVQLKLNEDGTLKARFFNRENDINYIGEGIGYTQGLGVSYEVDFNTFKELMQKVFNSKKAKKEKESKEQVPDSDVTPEHIQMSEQRKKRPTEDLNNDNKVPEGN
ncbi:translocation/assembly module TamB [Flavobacterium amniphilum]|uniref:translocation/assembly module TamB domain-containing protein n=1 Tax=Flavobacterium amniphilum TaxID=1834035 RepID=UPI00202ABBC0|nr:translocation/assembly module TamB domain-containing protein [Flavobacterium amniphilum]MCL9804335.1 translocation/assembly module TamB [Flavobacterium amniphilum]